MKPSTLASLVLLTLTNGLVGRAAASPIPAPAPAPRPKTELGVVVHLPDIHGTEAQWTESGRILDDVAATFGKGTMVRWDDQWSAQWEPFFRYPAIDARTRRVVGMLADRGLRSLMEVTPLPFPASAWFPSYAAPPVWGAGITADMRVWIARSYAGTIAVYRDELKVRKMPEAQNAVQFGNEPASGHPGGNATLPAGTWDPNHADLWKACNDAAAYGALTVVTPALSMQDGDPAIAHRERQSAKDGFAKWQAKAGVLALHDRDFAPTLAGAEYVRHYLDVTAKRAAETVALYQGQVTSKARTLTRDRIWITEGYVVEGDVRGSRAEAVALLLRTIRTEGIPGVAMYFLYSWSPSESKGFAMGETEKSAVRTSLANINVKK